MATSAKLMSADELLEMSDDGSRYELIEGELVELVPSGAAHGFVASNAGATLREFVRPRRLGAVFAAETGFVISTDPGHGPRAGCGRSSRPTDFRKVVCP